MVSEPNVSLKTATEIQIRTDNRIRHVRNIRYLGLARSLNLGLQEARGEYRATWVLVTNNDGFLAQPPVAALARRIPARADVRAWTDEYSSLTPILQWRLPSAR